MIENPQSEAPTGAPKLSELLMSKDFKPEAEKYWRLYGIASEAQTAANDLAKREFQRMAAKVIEYADARDLLILNEAFRDWYEFNGGDRVQGGTLIASILFAAGAKGGEELVRSAAMSEARTRLTRDGVLFVDDSEEIGGSVENV